MGWEGGQKEEVFLLEGGGDGGASLYPLQTFPFMPNDCVYVLGFSFSLVCKDLLVGFWDEVQIPCSPPDSTKYILQTGKNTPKSAY